MSNIKSSTIKAVVKTEDFIDKVLANNPGNMIRKKAVGVDLSDVE